MGVDIGCSGVGMVVGTVVGEVDRGSTTHQRGRGTMVQAGASNGDSVWACVIRWRSVCSGYGVVAACVAVPGVSVSNYPVGSVGQTGVASCRLARYSLRHSPLPKGQYLSGSIAAYDTKQRVEICYTSTRGSTALLDTL